MNKFLCVFLSILMILTIPSEAHAKEDPQFVYVYSHTTAQDAEIRLPLLDVNSTAYISASNAALLSGMMLTKETKDSATFTTGYHQVNYTGPSVTYDSVTYYELKSLMDSLSTSYKYDANSQSLFFVACESFYSNLLKDCETVYKTGYQLTYIDNPWGYGLAAIYNIIGDIRVDAIWGNYQKEQYKAALTEIMLPNNSNISIAEIAIQGNSLASDLSTIYAANQTTTKDIEEYCELFGFPYDDFLEAYEIINDSNASFSISDFLNITKNIYLSKNAYDLYVNAVKHGLYENKTIKKNNLKKAVKETYTYYTEHMPTFSDIFADTSATISNNISSDLLKKTLVEKLLGIKNVYVAIAKLGLDEMGLREMTTALEQTHACSEIQLAAKAQYKNALKKQKKQNASDAIDIKYSTILYLRACQYAYSLYAFDDELRWASEHWTSQTEEAIKTLSAYSDTELSRDIKNKNLDMAQDGFFRASISPTQLSEIYDILSDSVVYMFTDGGQSGHLYQDNPSDKPGGYRYDTNNDGYLDWIVCSLNNEWLICTGGSSNITTFTFDNDNSYVHFYDASKEDRLVVHQGLGVAGYTWEHYMVFDNNKLIELMYQNTYYNWETQQYETPEYKVDNKKANEKTYQEKLKSLGTLKTLEYTEFQFQKTTNIAMDSMEFVFNVLKNHAYVSQTKITDINGDKKKDYILYLAKDTNKCCIVLESSSNSIKVKICSNEQAEELIQNATIAEALETMKLLEDGDYQVTLYENKFYEKGNDLYAYVDVLSYIDFSAKYVSSLKIGDTLKMPPQHEYGDIVIKYMERDTYFNDIIRLNDECYLSENEDGTWLLRGHNDLPYTYISDQALILFSKDAVITNDLSSMNGEYFSSTHNPRDLFNSSSTYNSADVYIKISNKKVVDVLLPYRP